MIVVCCALCVVCCWCFFVFVGGCVPFVFCRCAKCVAWCLLFVVVVRCLSLSLFVKLRRSLFVVVSG